MKKNLFIIIGLMAATVSFVGCNASSAKSGTAKDSAETAETTEAVSTLATDSIKYEKSQNGFVTCNIKVDYPTANDSLSLKVRQYLAKALEDLYLPSMNGDEGLTAEKYKGDINDGKMLVDFYGKANYSYLSNMQKEISSEVPGDSPKLSYEIVILKTEETSTYITYQNMTYCYLGGAHGSAFDKSVNIIKATGKPLTETVDTTKVKELQPLLKKGVLSYLNKNMPDEKVTEEQLADYLFIDNGIIPIPAVMPYLTKEGVCFIYQQYEIGAYALGMVTFTVPYKDIKSFLTGEAIKLIYNKEI